MRWRDCDKKILALDERSRPIPLRRERPRRHLRLQGPRPSSPQKKKANTTPPLTPSPPPNKHPFPPPIHSLPLHPTRAHRSPYPCCYPPHRPGPQQYTHDLTHYPSPNLQPTLPPRDPHSTSLLTTSPLPFPLLSTIPFPPSTTTTPTQTAPPLHRLHRQHPLPVQWEPFTLDRYTSETDPDEHLKVYITHVALYTFQDAVFCKAFPTTLKRPYSRMVYNPPTLLNRQLRRPLTYVLNRQ